MDLQYQYQINNNNLAGQGYLHSRISHIIASKKLYSQANQSSHLIQQIIFIILMLNNFEDKGGLQVKEQRPSLINRFLSLAILTLVIIYYIKQSIECNTDTFQQNIIDLDYTANANSLPINLLIRNNNNQEIADILYDSQYQRERRKSFVQARIDFIKQKTASHRVYLAQYNFILDEQMQRNADLDNQKEWRRLEEKFKLSNFKEELSMCILVPSFNNNADFRIQGSLNSIFTQNYTNYKVVIINDASTDGTEQVYRKYLSFYKIDKKRYTFISNLKRLTGLQNLYKAAIKQCSMDSNVVIVDGDDELIGRNVLQVFNSAFQSSHARIVYSNFYFYNPAKSLKQGFTAQYSDEQKQKKLYRDIPMKFSHLRAAKAQIFHHLKVKDLQDHRKSYYKILYDQALFFPLMEIACGKVFKIEDEYNYLYNTGTGIGDYDGDFGIGSKTERMIRSSPKYSCEEELI